MRYKDKFRFVRKNMRKNRSRVFMTVLATAMGCAFLIVLASVGFGLQRSVVSEITEGRLLTEISIFGKKAGEDNYQPLTFEDIQKLEPMNNVKAVTRRQYVAQSPHYAVEGLRTQASTITVHMPSEAKAGFELSEGRLPQADDEVLVGYNFAEMLKTPGQTEGAAGTPLASSALLGKTMDMQVALSEEENAKTLSLPVKVVGIGKAPTREWKQDQAVYISEPTLKKIEDFTGSPRGEFQQKDRPGAEVREARTGYDQVNLYANDVQSVKKLASDMKEMGYMTHSIANELEQVNTIFLILKIGLIIVGTIAILIASIGIYNTMTMAVTERAQDIGIMKAIGAHPKTIKSVFLIESSYIGILGSLVGTAVAYIISIGVNLALPLVITNFLDTKSPEGLQFSYIPLSLTLICVAISLGVAILSGMRPAARATRTDVLKALRRDI